MRPNDIRVAPHFMLREFECTCCCSVRLHPELLKKLEALRQCLNAPVIITSGYRCESHNREVGGVEKSLHLRGQAADVAVPARMQSAFIALAQKIGFDQTIAYPARNFVHLGVFDDPATTAKAA
jgi:uncharacterized protein YcbK (DUF882 family)